MVEKQKKTFKTSMPGDKGVRLSDKERIRRYKEVNELKARVDSDYKKLIKDIKREHYQSMSKLHNLLNVIKRKK